MDDTILDLTGSTVLAFRRACGEAAGRIQGLDADALFQAVTESRDWFWSDPDRHGEGRADSSVPITRRALGRLGIDRPGLASEISESYLGIRGGIMRPFPGAIGALERLRQRGVRLALVTNGDGPRQRQKVELFDLARHFDYVHIQGERGFGKPDPRVYTQSMAALGSEPGSSWCVGDNLEWEVEAPQRLGLYAIWVDFARRGLPKDTDIVPDRIIYSLSELG